MLKVMKNYSLTIRAGEREKVFNRDQGAITNII